MLGCTVDLGLPASVNVTCSSDEECPGAMRCQESLGACVELTELDTTPPTLVSVSAGSAIQVTVVYSEAMAPGIEDLEHYSIVPPLQLTAAVVADNGLSVTLFTEPQIAGEAYALEVSGVFDAAQNPLGADGDPAARRLAFTGFGLRDASTPDLIAPVEVVLVRPTAVKLSWARRAGANRYRVQLSQHEDFSSVIVDVEVGETTMALPNADLDLPALTEPVTYYWRVRSNVTGAAFDSVYPHARFDLLTDAIHVHCPAGEPCGDVDAVGSRTRPFSTIQTGIGAASVHDISTVKVAARGGDEAYREQILLADGVTLAGGYDAGFAAQDPAANVTIIENDATVVVSAATTASAALDGFTVRGTGVVAQVSYGIAVSNVASFVLRRCKVFAPTADERSVGLNVTDSGDGTLGGGVLIEANEIHGGDAGAYSAGQSNGVRIQGSSATFRDNIITAGNIVPNNANAIGEFHSTALRQIDSRLIIDRNTLRSRDSAAAACSRSELSCASWTVLSYAGQLVLSSNVIVAGASESSFGVLVEGGGLVDYLANTFHIDATRGVSAAINQNGAAPRIVGNLFIVKGVPGTDDPAIRDIVGGFTCSHNVFVDYTCAFSVTPFGVAQCQTTTNPVTAVCSSGNGNAMLTAAQAAMPGVIAFDYRPGVLSSPVILGGGVEQADIPLDRDGRPRTCAAPGSCWSVGAYELDP